MKKALLLVIYCLASIIFWAGGAWGSLLTACVDPGGGGTHTTLQAALTAAEANGTSDIIGVVQGTYSGPFTFSSSEGNTIALYGGYTAKCATRVVYPTNTILDGGGSGRVLNLYNSNGGNITVDGFTLQHGGGAGTSYGAGVYASSRNESETGTTAAGAITITNNIFSENTGVNSGALHTDSTSIHGSSGNITVSSNVVTNNHGGMYGAGVNINSYTGAGTAGTVTISNNTITGNTVTSGNGGGVAVTSYSTSSTGGAITFTNNTIRGNTASDGAGISAYSSSTSGTGGTVTLTNNIVAGNTASNLAGGVDAYSISYAGGGIGGTVTFTNNTITGNTATSAGGLYLYKYGNTINVYNNIVWGNTASAGGDIYVSGSTGTTNGYNNDYTNLSGTWTNSAGNIDANPLFVDASVHNYHLSSTSPCIDAGNNSAPELPSTDFEGDARIITNSTVDIGADEYLCSNNPFKIGGTIYSYASIHAAYEAMTSGDTMQIHTSEYSEALALDLDKIVTLKGGYNCDFTSNTGYYTTIDGTITITSGTVIVENILIK